MTTLASSCIRSIHAYALKQYSPCDIVQERIMQPRKVDGSPDSASLPVFQSQISATIPQVPQRLNTESGKLTLSLAKEVQRGLDILACSLWCLKPGDHASKRFVQVSFLLQARPKVGDAECIQDAAKIYSPEKRHCSQVLWAALNQ